MMKPGKCFMKSGRILGAVLISAAILLFLYGFHCCLKQTDYQNGEGQIVVLFHNDISDKKLQNIADQYDGLIKIKKHIGDYALFSVEDSSQYQAVLDSLNSDPEIISAQADGKIKSLSTSKDTFSDTQWYIDNPGYYIDYSYSFRRKAKSVAGIDMNVAKAWKNMEESDLARREVVVAVIDTGIDYLHPDLADNMWINPGEIDGDHIDNDNNGYIDDIYGWDFYNNDASVCHYDQKGNYRTAAVLDNDNHGTHIAGIIAAKANNNIGIAGVASNIDIKIMSLKINGGIDGSGMLSDAVEAVKYATMMGADICNLSWGTGVYSESLYEVMKEADMLFVAAAGNSGDDNDEEPVYPASFELDNLISVTSLDSTGELDYYSNYGAGTVDMAAPGDNIYSTIVGRYAQMSGSSMAAPQVSAVAAMLYAYNEHIYATNVKKIIIDTIKPITGLKDRMKNPGIPDAYRAVTSAGELIQDTDAPKLSFETVYHAKEIRIPVHAEDMGGSKIRVIKWSYGQKKLEDFKHGVNGSLVEDNEVKITKPGIYTFYAADYAGNETVQTYVVKADITSPKLQVTFTAADQNKSKTVKVDASDSQSGIKQAKYLSGMKKAEDFLKTGSGTEIKLKAGKGTFSVKNDGIYTVYVTDYAGNAAVKTVIVKTLKPANTATASDLKKYVLAKNTDQLPVTGFMVNLDG